MPHDKSNIHVQRFPGTPTPTAVTPEDRSWLVLVAADGTATFWRHYKHDGLPRPSDQARAVDEGRVEHLYVDAELPARCIPVGADGTPIRGVTFPSSTEENPLDYEVFPGREPFGDAIDPAMHAAERARHLEACEGFYARLNARSVMAWGATEHEAVRGLLNYVAKLCTAGSLDHTGAPCFGNERRRRAVWGAPA